MRRSVARDSDASSRGPSHGRTGVFRPELLGDRRSAEADGDADGTELSGPCACVCGEPVSCVAVCGLSARSVDVTAYGEHVPDGRR